MNVGIVVTEVLDGRFSPWEKSLEWESYLDLYCLALAKRGHRCVKYVPSIGVSSTRAYRHKFGHLVKRVPAYNRLLAPRALLRPRAYAGGLTTIFRQALGPAFTLNLLAEAERDDIQVMHYSSYYSSFFIPAVIVSPFVPTVVQYTGGALPADAAGKLYWKASIMPSLASTKAVLLGEYRTESQALVHDLGVPKSKQEFFNAPIIDRSVFHELDKRASQEDLGFDPRKRNVLCVTYIPTRHSLPFAKDPYLMIDLLQAAVKQGGEDIMVHVAGWGTGEEEFREYIQGRGMAGKVRLFGHVEHSRLPAYYSACDIVFVPYRLERLNEGSATVEAFACHRPVVALKRSASDPTDQPGGFLAEDDPERGGQTLLERLRRPGYLEEKAQEGGALAGEYTMEFAGLRLEQIYSKVLDG